jgi:hypothetical protein
VRRQLLYRLSYPDSQHVFSVPSLIAINTTNISKTSNETRNLNPKNEEHCRGHLEATGWFLNENRVLRMILTSCIRGLGLLWPNCYGPSGEFLKGNFVQVKHLQYVLLQNSFKVCSNMLQTPPSTTIAVDRPTRFGKLTFSAWTASETSISQVLLVLNIQICGCNQHVVALKEYCDGFALCRTPPSPAVM